MATRVKTKARGLAVAALALIGVWAVLSIALGLSSIAGDFGGMSGVLGDTAPNGLWMNIEPLLFAAWVLCLNGLIAAAAMGAVSIARASVHWWRWVAFVFVVIAGPATSFWWVTRPYNDEPWHSPGGTHAMLGQGLSGIAVVVALSAAWLLKPALTKGPEAPPPTDPNTLLYSESTT